MEKLNFKVDSRLAALLSQEYSSTERALKELVDNSWDADAERVDITLPEPMSDQPILISDNGVGMTAREIDGHYLKIASDSRARRGERTSRKNRIIKGRKGIGKFAGLMAAAEMHVKTSAHGSEVKFSIDLGELEKVSDIGLLPINPIVTPCHNDMHGTCITLSRLHQKMAYPDATRLRQILIREYGRQKDFHIYINDKKLEIDDLEGTYVEDSTRLSNGELAEVRFSISSGKSSLREPGITLIVLGKAVGSPSFFGLDKQDDFPAKLLKKCYGEVVVDGLSSHVTAGWDSVIENSDLLGEVNEYVQNKLRDAFKETHGAEIRMAHARLQKSVHERLSALPEFKRTYADKAIKKILEKYYDEPANKVEPIVFVVLEAIERSDYRSFVEHIADTPRGDISNLAESLNRFGLADMAFLVEQAMSRSIYLDQLEELVQNPDTLESTVHKALEKNLWILGNQYSLFSSNQTLERLTRDFLGKDYRGEIPGKRPDLLLSEDINGTYLLIEFKRPSHSLKFKDYQQATEYRHSFADQAGKEIKVIIIGGSISTDYPSNNVEPNVLKMTFSEVISTARRQIQWQMRCK